MNRIPVTESSAIVSVGYDESAAVLEVEFKGGRAYRYDGIGRETYDSLMSAKSKGAYVNSVIVPMASKVEFVKPEPAPEQVEA